MSRSVRPARKPPYLTSEECDKSDVAPDLTKAEASKRIDALKAKRSPVRPR